MHVRVLCKPIGISYTRCGVTDRDKRDLGRVIRVSANALAACPHFSATQSEVVELIASGVDPLDIVIVKVGTVKVDIETFHIVKVGFDVKVVSFIETS
ncbi:MAG: hypothetical protein WA972_19215 [Rhodococcus qingshengii]